MKTYLYKKDFEINAPPLIDMIRLSSIYNKFQDLKVCYDHEKNLMSSVEVTMIEVLLSEDEDALSSIINDYSPACDMQVRYNLKNDLITPAMIYGREIVAHMGANNVFLSKSNEHISQISSELDDITKDLNNGSLRQAYFKCLALTPKDYISQNEINEFTKRVGWFLGL